MSTTTNVSLAPVVRSGSPRGTTNGNARGSAADRRRRREWLVSTYRADVDGSVWRSLVDPDNIIDVFDAPLGTGTPACRCYRCGLLLTVETVTVDRIIPGCQGGTYRRNNIRPACGACNSETGGAVRSSKRGSR